MILFIVLPLLLLLLFLIRKTPKETPFINVKIVKKPIDLQRGLMFVKSPLPENTGMLFDFGRIANHTLWMKNTFIPLDLIFLNKNSEVLGFIENAPPLREQLLGIDSPSRFVLEANSGWVNKNKIKIGDFIQIV